MLIKMGEAATPQLTIVNTEDALNNQAISERFSTLVDKIKTVDASGGVPIAPFKSDDFLYFRTAIMHAAEKSNFNEKGDQAGDGKFVVEKTASGKDIWKWSSEKGIHPYMNSNGDIFPEDELVRAASTWIGKGLYCNHQSSDVEKLRGIIIDTQYDSKSKALWALVALDRKNFPILASQVQNGTIRNVSMGTAVKRSFCTLCGNEAVVEADYCTHIKSGFKNKIVDNGHGKQVLVGEINVGLNGVELSLVSIPADGQATIRHVYASLQSQFDQIRQEIDSEGTTSVKEATLKDIKETLDAVKVSIDKKGTNETIGGTSMNDLEKRAADRRKALLAYYQGTVDPKPGQTMYAPDPMNEKLRNEELAKAKKEEGETSGKMGDKGSDQVVRKEQQRVIAERAEKREKIRQAYMQGTTEPKSPTTYTPDPMEQKLRSADESKFTSEARATGVKSTGMAGDDEACKKKIQRANYLGARFTYAKNSKGDVIPADSYWTIYAADEADAPFDENKALLKVTAGKAYGSDLHKVACDEDGSEDANGRTNWAFMASRDYGQQLVEFVKSKGADYVASQFQKIAEMPGMPGPMEGAGGAGNMGASPDAGMDAGLGGPEGEDLPTEDVLEDVPEAPADDPARAVELLEEATDIVKEMVGGDEPLDDEGAEALDTSLDGLGEANPDVMDKDVPQGEKEEAVKDMPIAAFHKSLEVIKYAKKKKEEKEEKDEKKDKKKKDDDDDDEKDEKKGKGKKKGEDKDEKDEKDEKKGGPKKGVFKGCGKPNFLCKCKKDASANVLTTKNASPTGNEVKDISIPANNSGKLTSPTGNEVKDIPDIVAPYLTDSVESDNVGGQDMKVESVKDQHDKDMAAATSNPTDRGVKDQTSASAQFASKVGEAITAGALEQAKTLAVAKMKTAYELASEMAEKGYIGDKEVKAKADEFYAMSDEAFNSVKRVVAGMQSAKNEVIKTASAVASLGNINGDRTMPANSTDQKSLAEHISSFNWK